ncbi:MULTISPECIES: hypothetical protein [Streptomyces]|uniref:WXG100 family type VII secretion target n=2 Tax=Streptomyces TaxID=1883 RepID=A0ABV9IL91_9ACTN
MAEEYSADRVRLRNAIQQIAQLSEMGEHLMARFTQGLTETTRWYGEDDDFAREIGPQARRETQGTLDTGRSVVAAVSAVTDGTNTNLKNINETQGNNLEGILSNANKQHGGRR